MSDDTKREVFCYTFGCAADPLPGLHRCAEHADQLHRLDERVRSQKHQIDGMRRALEEKNRALDAMHWVWCNGGCPSGVHRYGQGRLDSTGEEHVHWLCCTKGGAHRFSTGPLTEEHVVTAERNVVRMRAWWQNAGRPEAGGPKTLRSTYTPRWVRFRAGLRMAWRALRGLR